MRELVWRSGHKLQESVLFHKVGPGDRTRSSSLATSAFNLLSPLTCLFMEFIYLCIIYASKEGKPGSPF